MPDAAPALRLILASASPRRQDLLREAGYEFIVHPADVDESNVPPDLLPADIARYLAGIKAAAVAPNFPNDLTLAADTVVAFGDLPLGKAVDEADARRILTLLSGTTHIVITGVCVQRPSTQLNITRVVMSAVHMRDLTPSEIAAYLATGDWQGKAGAYGIQDADPFVTRMSGSLTNIVGLPMEQTTNLLSEAGVVPRK